MDSTDEARTCLEKKLVFEEKKMQGKQKEYYYTCSFPESYRIVAYTIGIDTTILSPLHLIQAKNTPATENQCPLESLIELAENPQIDHIYASVGDLFFFDKEGYRVDAGEMVIDLCDKNLCLKKHYLFGDSPEGT